MENDDCNLEYEFFAHVFNNSLNSISFLVRKVICSSGMYEGWSESKFPIFCPQNP